MKSFNKSRVAAFGMSGALALGTVASVGAITPASALESTYGCPTSTGTVLEIPVSVANPFAGSYLPGEAVPSVPVQMNATLTPAVLGLIGLLLPPGTTEISGTITGAAMGVGSQAVPLNDMAAPTTTIDPTGTVLPVAGTTSPFTAVPGNHQVNLPSSLVFTPTGLPALALTCNLSGPSSVGAMSVAKYDSTTTAKLKNAPITTAKRARILARVVSNGAPAAGQVVAKEGSKVLAKGTLSDLGKKVLRLPLLKRGSHTIVVVYKGNGTTKVSRKSLTFRVRRA